MKLHTLGNSDLHVPSICLGSMTWGAQNTESEAHEQLDYAVDKRGLTFIDTAEMYPVPPSAKTQGRTETYIGTWLKKRGGRDKLIIATKIAPATSELISTRTVGSPSKLDRKSIRAALEGSLKRLQTDYVDLYQIHWPERRTNFFGIREFPYSDQPDDSTPIQETLEALAELIQEGKIRYIGVSNETAWGVAEYLRLAREQNLPRIISIQNQYSLTNRTFEIGLSEFCQRENVGLLAYSALNMGVLSGKYLGDTYPKNARFSRNNRSEERYNPKNTYAQIAIAKYVEVAKKHALDPAQMAIAFVCSRGFTASTIIGATTMAQLKTCIDAGEIQLRPELIADIEAINRELPSVTV